MDNRETLNDIIFDAGISVPETVEVEVGDVQTEENYNKSRSNEKNSLETDISEMNIFFERRYLIYKDVLAPELRRNEELKRIHKTKLMNNVFRLLKYQFIFMYVLVFCFLVIIGFSNWIQISETVVLEIISFIKFFITSVIVELISILLFIVKNVFDKSIVDLFKNFDTKDTDKHDIKNN